MNKSKLNELFKSVKNVVTDNCPEILTGVGVAGLISTTVLAVKATPKACVLLDEAENRKGEELTKVETIKYGWKPFVPVILSGGFSIACIIGAQSVNAKRNAALATAYKLSEEALTVYKRNVIETIGEKKEHAIEHKAMQERIDNRPLDREIVIANNTNVLCFDVMSGRYFESSIQEIKEVELKLNCRMGKKGGQDYVSLSEFYDEIGLSHTKVSDDIGWNVWREEEIDVRFYGELTKDNRPCVAVDFAARPDYNFDRLY